MKIRLFLCSLLVCMLCVFSAGAATVWNVPLTLGVNTANTPSYNGAYFYNHYGTHSSTCPCGATSYNVGSEYIPLEYIQAAAGNTVQFYSTPYGTNIAYAYNYGGFQGWDITAHYNIAATAAVTDTKNYTARVAGSGTRTPTALHWTCSTCGGQTQPTLYDVGYYNSGGYTGHSYTAQAGSVSVTGYNATVGVQYYIEDLVLKNATTNGFTLYASRAVQINGGSYKGAPA